MLPSRQQSNGHAPLAPRTEADEDDVAVNQQIRDLDEKIDDIRSSMAGMAVAQATTAGDVKVLAATVKGFEERIEDRLEVLEQHRAVTEWQKWGERLAAAVIGASCIELARRALYGG